MLAQPQPAATLQQPPDAPAGGWEGQQPAGL